MPVPDWRKLALNDGIVPEPIADAERIALWLRGNRDANGQDWERIANVGRAQVSCEDGFCSTPATAIYARQQIRGFFGKLVQRFRESATDRNWVLPSGEAAEQVGERRNDLLLVWPEGNGTVDEARIKTRWPESKEVRKLADTLFLVTGVQPPEIKSEPVPPQQSLGAMRESAEQSLAAIRRGGDRRKEAAALTDLGVLYCRENDPARAAPPLESALALARQLDDRALERDILGNLGMAYLMQGRTQRALELFNQELAFAREAGDRYAEKSALEHQGMAWSRLSDAGRSFAAFEGALALARELGDRQHQADLLWTLSILHAEVGQRDPAVDRGQEAVDLLRSWGKPQAGILAEQLDKYRLGGTGIWPGGAAAVGNPFSGSIIASTWAMPASQPGQAASGPGLLKMAFSLMKSMGKFVGSGMKAVSAETYQRRVRTCATCEHHTGMRCKICGCFTSAKAWLPHEECPPASGPRVRSTPS